MIPKTNGYFIIIHPSVYLQVSTPVSLPIGNWTLRVVTRLKNSTARELYDFNQDLYILFNPWNQGMFFLISFTMLETFLLFPSIILNELVWLNERQAYYCWNNFHNWISSFRDYLIQTNSLYNISVDNEKKEVV